jgi:Bacterial Ig-like domain (group 3)/FG-GAP-like repeat/FG-GAP repeat
MKSTPAILTAVIVFAIAGFSAAKREAEARRSPGALASAKITVLRRPNTEVGSNRFDLVINSGALGVVLDSDAFSPHADSATGALPQGVAVGDLNGDGKLDLVTTNDGDSTVSVLLGNGNGTFQPHVDYPTGFGPTEVAVGDFNGDGKLDLAVATQCGTTPLQNCFGEGAGGTGTVSILLGNGDGTFQPHVEYPGAKGGTLAGITVGDFNGDGKADVAATDNGINTSGVSVFLGSGDGTFQPHMDLSTGSDSQPEAVAAADFNGDGKLDLVAGGSTTNVASVFLGNGDGTFQARVDYATASHPAGVAAGDFNGDGKIDLVLAAETSNTVSVLLGNGDGTFQTHRDFATGSTPTSVAVADFNGDGKLDLATADFVTSGMVSILQGNGDGTFRAHADFATGSEPFTVAVGDFNRDGSQDVAAANLFSNTVSVLINATGTRIALASVPNPSKVGQPVTFTATVKAAVTGAGMPSGAVKFLDGRGLLGTATLANEVATLTSAKLSAGSHKITAQYSGDSVFSPNISRALVQKVNP